MNKDKTKEAKRQEQEIRKKEDETDKVDIGLQQKQQ